MDGKEIITALGAVYKACATIMDGDGCDSCPLKYSCIDETSFAEICDMIPADCFDEMIELAENIDYSSGADWDTIRKADIEERMIDAEWGI